MVKVRTFYNAYKKTRASLEQMRAWLRFEWRYEAGRLFRLSDGGRPNASPVYGSTTLTVHGFRIREHHAIWLMFNDDLPRDKEIDHENKNEMDNHIENLRLATRVQNATNRSKFKGNRTSKYKGVYRGTHSWRAEIQANKKRHNLGSFKTEVEAALAYNAAAIIHHGEFALLNQIEEGI